MPGVYLSFPFCAQKCTFCNFASGVFPRELEREYLSALTNEIRRHQWRWTPDTLFIGGGTPSRIDPVDLKTLLDTVPGRPWREATIEAAPGSLTGEMVGEWFRAGINRVSLGVQSFISGELAGTGRRHNAVRVEDDCRLLRQHGLTNLNIDLIAGLPLQTPESWTESLDWIEKLSPTHVSVYMFEIDEDSRLGLEVIQGGQRYGADRAPNADQTAEFYETAVTRLAGMGIKRYEISNFATPGNESLHNLKYWQLDPYIGFGADAHSFDAGRRWGNIDSVSEYVKYAKAGQPVALPSVAAITDEERFFVGLRLMSGVDADVRDRERYGPAIRRLADAGLVLDDGRRLRLTDRGVLLSNEVFEEFIA